MSQPTPQKFIQSSQEPKFGGVVNVVSSVITPEAVKQFAQDTAGVWLPKAPVSLLRNAQLGKDDPTAQRVNKIQFFEDTFLEFVEDGAFYFTVPVVGTAVGALIAKMQGGLDYKQIGQSWAQYGVKDFSKTVPTKLLAAKSGAILGALGSAFAFEYMIQHWKNVITAKKFHTTNFTGVAGLEHSRVHIAQGESDPVAKATKRQKQVGALWLGTMGTALAMPWVFKRFVKEESQRIPKLLRYLNFGSSGKSQFDTHKGFQGLLTLVGLASYLDASRDKLEFKEQATRLSVVIPYLLFGQALAGNFLAKGLEKLAFFKDAQGKFQSLKDLNLTLLDVPKGQSLWGAMWNKGTTPETILKLDLGKEASQFKSEVEKLVTSGAITQKVADKIKMAQSKGLYWSSLALGAAVCGVGINLVAYRQTNKRHQKQEVEKQKKMVALQPVQPAQGRTVFQSYGGFAAQGKPLEDPASAAAIAAPKVQAPFQGARLSTNPYGYGQWRI